MAKSFGILFLWSWQGRVEVSGKCVPLQPLGEGVLTTGAHAAYSLNLALDGKFCFKFLLMLAFVGNAERMNK